MSEINNNNYYYYKSNNNNCLSADFILSCLSNFK